MTPPTSNESVMLLRLSIGVCAWCGTSHFDKHPSWCDGSLRSISGIPWDVVEAAKAQQRKDLYSQAKKRKEERTMSKPKADKLKVSTQNRVNVTVDFLAPGQMALIQYGKDFVIVKKKPRKKRETKEKKPEQ